jgi:hypothetical protein
VGVRKVSRPYEEQRGKGGNYEFIIIGCFFLCECVCVCELNEISMKGMIQLILGRKEEEE